MGLPPAAIEKDWWVIMILRVLFRSDVSKQLLKDWETPPKKNLPPLQHLIRLLDLDELLFGDLLLGKGFRGKTVWVVQFD